MKNKKTILTIGITLIIGIFIVILVLSITNDKENTNKNMEIIKDNYNNLSNNVNKYNQIRTDLSNKLNDFIYEDYEEEHNNYLELLNKYNSNIQNIDNNIKAIANRCNNIYTDKDVNKICDSYQKLYEKLINLYINDMNNYNNKITSYNDYKESNISLFTLIHNDYIDYNNDGIYEGKDIENTSN